MAIELVTSGDSSGLNDEEVLLGEGGLHPGEFEAILPGGGPSAELIMGARAARRARRPLGQKVNAAMIQNRIARHQRAIVRLKALLAQQ